MDEEKNTLNFKIQTFEYRGHRVKTVFCNGVPHVIATDALLRIAQGRVSVGATPYYALQFLEALDEMGISSLSDVTCADIRKFADSISGVSDGIVDQYVAVINGLFDSFVELGGIAHPTIIGGDATFCAFAKPYKSTHHLTIAGKVLQLSCKKPKKEKDYSAPSYLKWYTDDQIDIICKTLSLRDRCIFLISVEAGYRISSVLSIKLDFNNLKNGIVTETRSKTGKTHPAKISAQLTQWIVQYVSGQRRRVVQKAGNDPGNLFLTTTGNSVVYSHFYKNLKYSQKKISNEQPEMNDISLHTHAGRSTYFNRLMHKNQEAKAKGMPSLSDQQIMHLMDWKTMDCLSAYYNFMEKGIDPSALWHDLFDEY